MGGILKKDNYKPSYTEPEEFDRKQVLKNTELNAQLGIEGEKVRKSLHTHNEDHASSDHRKYPKTKAPKALKDGEFEEDKGFSLPSHDVGFDEKGISEWDKERGMTEKITEPNTPYMGTAADTEYYDDDPVPDLDMGATV